MPHSTPLITTIVGGLALAYILGMIAQRLKISPLVGYLAAGVLAGPFTPGFVADTSLAPELAEIGVILLMFGVGLHFSLKDLMAVKAIAIPGAIAQIAVATLLGLGLSAFFGWGLFSGIVFGLCLSTASTVVLLRALEERGLIDSQRGQIAIGWLIVEDLAMVLALVLLPAIANMLESSDQTNISQLMINLGITVGKVVAFILIMMIVGRKLIPWILAKTAATGSRELFTLSVLALALGIAYGAVTLFDASFALGAFFAGMVLNESELSHRAAQDTLPLRDAFAVLFFVSVGMLFDPMVLIEHPLGILATLAIIIIGKSVAALVLVRMFGHSRRTALTISVSLAQIGEFAFILAGLGVALNVLEPDARNLVLAGALVSIMLNPVLFSLLDRYLAKTETKEEVEQLQQEELEEEMPVPVDICGHAIIVGYGRAGSMLAEKLLAQSIPLVIIENSRNKFAELKEKSLNTVLGNASTKESLALARIDCAKSLLLTIPNGYEAADIAETARSMNPDLNIIVRAHFDDIIVRANYDEEASFILEKGANHVIIDEDQTASAMADMLIKEVEFGCAIDDTPENGQQIIAPSAAQ
ncbi:YbaL family putative K(+) efflux transporter [Proteus faecis]|uniref:YbaL family putative K(+) efflux transporter n=1 Tax=Proteus faecis TaxID=2050967 RepID=A0AAW7CK95_9GAMM|nr:YbaL family putative K(+) efflux transporter [Proteus faecis]MBG3013170.1 Kef family K(+) transporter [Proteus mirabilis]MDL5166340.1 YbaL family putative K(+) efflux transporter [Proteus faecis]MDL5274324.1 YbaL family putative K(+) efflux transporter [Proteus faecis]MDL5277894.1 YbaL family putative K(+) efflux transporter [Proteus faecis]MDL5306884.1 YbaL family putative K(+) efflux transporter [Proteus faecis]